MAKENNCCKKGHAGIAGFLAGVASAIAAGVVIQETTGKNIVTCADNGYNKVKNKVTSKIKGDKKKIAKKED